MREDTSSHPTSSDVRQALRGVDDPEYPGISVIDMGMIGDVTVAAGEVTVELIPTFSGCPALDFIRADIVHALEKLPGVRSVSVARSPVVWHTGRLSARARRIMATEFTVAVELPGRLGGGRPADLQQRGSRRPVAHRSLRRGRSSSAGDGPQDALTGSGAPQHTASLLEQRVGASGARRMIHHHEDAHTGGIECPVCGRGGLVERSAFGPTRCRAVYRCEGCGEVVEVLRA